MFEPTVRRSRRPRLTDKQVTAFARKPSRYIVSDPEQRGMYVRVPPKGLPRSCASRAILTASRHGPRSAAPTCSRSMKPVRKRGRRSKRIKEGKSAFEELPPEPESFQAVAERWLKCVVAKNKLRSQPEIERRLKRDIYPTWARRSFTDLRRSDIRLLLDYVEDEHGARMADVVLGVVSRICNWFAAGNDDYTSPIVRGMARDTAEPRDRILNDTELRSVWCACEGAARFGAFVQLLLTTAQRAAHWRTCVGRPRRRRRHIAEEERAKGTGGDLKLPPLALSVLHGIPRLASSPYVFADRSGKPTTNFNDPKMKLDKRSGVRDWVLHDLRRTARSLMSRAGVQSEHAEKCLGHAIAGVKGVYDRHSYFDQKRIALEKLASLIEQIVYAPVGGNIVPLRAPGP